MRFIWSAFCVLALATASQASLKINEALINPAPGADNGFEFVEIKSTTPSESVSGVTFVVIEGDGAAAGTIDVALDLSAFGSTGSNSLLLVRDAATVLLPAPDPFTTVGIFDFNPDIENGSNTFLLVRGFTGAVNQDLDTNNDGILDVTPWTSVDGGYGWIDTAVIGDFSYATALGGTDFAYPGFAPEAYSEVSGGLKTSMRVTTAIAGGPYTIFVVTGVSQVVNPAATFLIPPPGWSLTPGSENTSYSSIVAPSNATVTQGLFFGGTLASFVTEDSDKYFVLNDDFENIGIVDMTFSGITSASSMKAMVVTSASRNDISQFTRLFEPASNTYTNIDFRTTTFANNAFTVNVANPSFYVNIGTGQVLARLFFIPQADIDAADGWTESIDRFVLEITP